ncbi:6-phosphogluconolactonase [Sphingobacterium bambusae]|uniref:6-phosphogluconolactonase n=1 Tax=Sphingobacterium bambusae TaxID=662858 RepID=A0ABW6BBF9_9SPHI|nr:6-phosphogluconolactonase [Sphingobacterium bambusae]WPL46945.1 6-phosphogluconolactonase [Sphingobacterium bambusae]
MSVLYDNIHVFLTAKEAGQAAGRAVEEHLVLLQKQQKEVRMIFAAAPSQDYLLDYLSQSTKIVWENVVAFNMDEYIGLPVGSPQLFASYLEDRLFSKVTLGAKYTISAEGDINEEIQRVTAAITAAPIDLVCLGIGENGHLAFNDPPVADFDDDQVIKEVELDLVCRQQQVNDGCFATLDDVPATALTLTIPTLLQADALFCVVVGKHKREAVAQAVHGAISTDWPATILRTHANCNYFFDKDSYTE